jgi:hypothetical protein
VTAISKIGGIEAQTGDHNVGMFLFCENGDPSARAGIAVMHEVARNQRRTQYTGVVQRKRNSSGAIVADSGKGVMPSAQNKRLVANRVHRPNGGPHAYRRIRGCVGNAVTQNCVLAGNKWISRFD